MGPVLNDASGGRYAAANEFIGQIPALNETPGVFGIKWLNLLNASALKLRRCVTVGPGTDDKEISPLVWVIDLSVQPGGDLFPSG